MVRHQPDGVLLGRGDHGIGVAYAERHGLLDHHVAPCLGRLHRQTGMARRRCEDIYGIRTLLGEQDSGAGVDRAFL